MAFDDGGNVVVDFVWGRMAMQPNTGRTGDGSEVFIPANGAQNKGWSGTLVYPSETLDPALGDHIVATSGYLNFPDYSRDTVYQDTVANVSVPNVVGLTQAAAETAITDANLSANGPTTTVTGATTVNDGKVKTQTPAAGTVVNVGTAVDTVLFAAPTVPNLAGLDEAEATQTLLDSNLVIGTVTTSATGATAENDGTVKSQTPVDGIKANTGSAVNVVLYAYSA